MRRLLLARNFWIGFLATITLLFSIQAHPLNIGLQPALGQEAQAEHLSLLPATVSDSAEYGKGIRRTLYRLATSTPDHRNTVRILFYGQSITKQEWWVEVANTLRQQFPDAHLIVENRAIGGFASPLLVRTAEHDLYPFYPDLTIFHVYGDEENYEAIIANARRRTTSEILIASDHIDWLPTGTESENSEALRRYRWHNHHAQWLRSLAAQYGCEFVDVRSSWRQYLEQSNLRPEALLSDKIHLNRQGNRLMAKLITDHILQSPIPEPEELDQSIVDYRETDLHWQNNTLMLEFEGNRVDLVTQPSDRAQRSTAKFLIDGKPPSYLPGLYSLTRPSDAPGVDWPSILQIGSASPLIAEDWTLIITEASSEMDQFSFDLYGSQTGFDGSGNSQQKFISNSGRVVIEPENWWLENAYNFTQQSVPVGFQIRWRVVPLFNDTYTAPLAQGFTNHERITTIAQNLVNSRHTLEVTALGNDDVSIESIRVYRPRID